MARCNHHLAKAVDERQALAIHLKEAVHGGAKLDFALLDVGFQHLLVFAQIAQDAGGIVFVQHAFIRLPHIKMLLANGKQHGDILRLHDMSLAKNGVLGYALDDLR